MGAAATTNLGCEFIIGSIKLSQREKRWICIKWTMARSLLEAYSGNNIGTRGGVVGREFDARLKHGLTPRYIVPQGDAFEGRAIDVLTYASQT